MYVMRHAVFEHFHTVLLHLIRSLLAFVHLVSRGRGLLSTGDHSFAAFCTVQGFLHLSCLSDCLQGKCTFGPRLSDEDIQRLSKYVLDQAAVKWK